jgi:hypothetical protein
LPATAKYGFESGPVIKVGIMTSNMRIVLIGLIIFLAAVGMYYLVTNFAASDKEAAGDSRDRIASAPSIGGTAESLESGPTDTTVNESVSAFEKAQSDPSGGAGGFLTQYMNEMIAAVKDTPEPRSSSEVMQTSSELMQKLTAITLPYFLKETRDQRRQASQVIAQFGIFRPTAWRIVDSSEGADDAQAVVEITPSGSATMMSSGGPVRFTFGLARKEDGWKISSFEG